MSSRDLPTRSFGRAVAERLTSLRRDQRGAVIVLVAVSMVAFLGMLALALDVAGWYQTHRHAQATADATALAAANYMAGGDTTSDATTQAITYAGYNGLTITSSNISFDTTHDKVTITVPTTAPSYFAQVLGVGTRSVSATATASWNITSTACATPGNTCYAIFASDTSCVDGSSTAAITFSGSGNTITGGVHSNGSIYLQGGGNQHLGPTTYGTGSGCTAIDTGGGGGNTYASGPTAQAPVTTWPDDYSTILTACGGTGQVACTGPGGTPAYCNAAQANYTFGNGGDTLTTQQVYCAYGTGNVKLPTTWNGSIVFQSGALGSATTPILGTWIAGTINVDHKSYLAPQTTTPTYPLFYAVGTGTCSVCMTAAGSQVSGAIFAPNGTIEFNGGGSTANFLESKDVNIVGGAFTGNGPLLSGGGSGSTSGSDSLTQ